MQGGGKQKGYAMLLIVLGLVLGALAFLAHNLNATESHLRRDEITRQALAQAKEALIGWSATHQAGPGHLPCPSPDEKGMADTISCGSLTTRVGRLPWQLLGLPDLRDGNGEQLWYAVSRCFLERSNDSYCDSYVVNSDTQGQLEVQQQDGGSSKAIAIIFSPGKAVTNSTGALQIREPGTPGFNDAKNYLEGKNGDGTAVQFEDISNKKDVFEIRPTCEDSNCAGGAFNDQLVLIRAEDLFPTVANEVARRIKTEIVPMLNYYRDHWKASGTTGFYPDPLIFQNANLQSRPAPGDCGMGWGLTQGLIPPASGCVNWDPTTATIDGTPCISVSASALLPGELKAAQCTTTSTGAPIEIKTGIIGGAARSLVVLEPSLRINNGASAPWNIQPTTTAATSSSDISATYTLNSVAGDTIEVTLPLYTVQQQMLDVKSIDTAWFFENAWYRHTLYAASIKNLPDTNGASCVPGTDCLTALGAGGTHNNKEALLILAGPALPSVTSPRTGAIGEYFEDKNADGNALEFKSARRSKTFNDQLVIVSP
jgi:hypothetical protein